MVNGLRVRIQNLRLSMGLSVKQFAAYVGVSSSSISRYESGDREPSLHNLSVIALKLKVTTDYLLGIEDATKKGLDPFNYELLGLSPDQAQAIGVILHSFRKANE